MSKNNIVHIPFLVVIVLLLFVTLIISPYKYEWEPGLKQINDDTVLVLRLFLVLLISLNLGGAAYAQQKKQKIKYLYLVIFLLAGYKLLKTFFL
jgi:membrane protein YdbS with pleckstrin-like domain